MKLAHGALAALLILTCRDARAAGLLERLEPERLRATHMAVEQLAAKRRPVTLASGYRDLRAMLHVHSSLSHDSRSSIEEVVQAAKQAGVEVLMFTEHPAPSYDFVTDGHQGMRDGVLLIPGAEIPGLLLYPTRSLGPNRPAQPQALVDATTREGGLAFLSHLEERLDWNLEHLTGSEIYNVHADFKDELQPADFAKMPAAVVKLLAGLSTYPQEAFAAIQDYPTDYLRRYDQLCQKQRLTGIAAADAHHNQRYRARRDEQGRLELVDFDNKRLTSLPAAIGSLAGLVAGSGKPGDVLAEVDLDPYARTFRYISTHLLTTDLSREAVWDALGEGRAYVAFDWIGDPTGFVFLAENGERRWSMGAEIPYAPGIKLRAAAPLPCRFKLIRDGKEVDRRDSDQYQFAVERPGVYRLEAWIELVGEQRPWIFSNPIYVRAPMVR
jgi:hypothetical protein